MNSLVEAQPVKSIAKTERMSNRYHGKNLQTEVSLAS